MPLVARRRKNRHSRQRTGTIAGGYVALSLLFSLLSPAQAPADDLGEEDETSFLGVVLKDTEEFWNAEFEKRGLTYKLPILALYTAATKSACGIVQASSGPLYCPGDQSLYLDPSFFSHLRDGLKAPGDFAKAYVVAHLVGHHVQQQIATEASLSESQRELQADCFAGLWTAFEERQGYLDEGDLDEGRAAIKSLGGPHQLGLGDFGNAPGLDRVNWFDRGLSAVGTEGCDLQ